jgi:hypothetical protein
LTTARCCTGRACSPKLQLQKVKAYLKADCLLRAKNSALDVEGCLAAGEYIEVWHHLKGWYHSVEDQASKPCPETLAKQMQERIELYAARRPPGWPLSIHVDPAPIPVVALTDAELGTTTEPSCGWRARNEGRALDGVAYQHQVGRTGGQRSGRDRKLLANVCYCRRFGPQDPCPPR